MGTKIDMAQLPRGLLSWLPGHWPQWHEIQGFAFQLWPQIVSGLTFEAKPSRPRARADTSFASRVPLKLTLCVSPHWSASREAEVPGTGCQYRHLDIYKRHSVKWNTTTTIPQRNLSLSSRKYQCDPHKRMNSCGPGEGQSLLRLRNSNNIYF